MAFEREMVGSNASSCVENPNSTSRSTNGVLNSSSPKAFSPRSHVEDTCFHCQKRGHWAKNCPNKSPKKSSEPLCLRTVLGIDGAQYVLCLFCPCGAGTCTLLTSGTEKNPGRKFYRCPAKSDIKCRFFKWSDEVESNDFVYVPVCSCGAGPCRVSIEENGPNVGRKFFVCPIKKGQGACEYFRLLDTQVITTNGHVDQIICSPQSMLTDCCDDDTSPTNSDLVDERNFSHQGIEIESPAVDTVQCISGGQSKRMSKLMLVELEGQDTSNEPRERLRCGTTKIDDSILFDSATEWKDMPREKSRDPSVEEELQASVLIYQTEIHQRQVEFWREISIAEITLLASYAASSSCSSALPTNSVPFRETCLVTAATNRNLGLHVPDWWGRLAFPPSRCLMIPATKPFFCCIFPSLDLISAPRNVPPKSLLAAEDNKLSSPLSPVQDAQPSSVVCLPGLVHGGYIMTSAVLEGFTRLAVDLQNKLLSLLESMDFHNHESMVQEASTTFAALKQMSIDYRPFCERVMEFIGRASSLAEIENSLQNHDRSSQKLADQCNHAKLQLDDISRACAEAMAGREASRERLRLLGEDASRVREMLFQIETELSCCKAENKLLEARFVRISEDMVESEQRFRVASKAAKEALQICRQREEERHAAKLALMKARIRLRP